MAIKGSQGGFSELGMNAGAGGIGDGHPALLDKTVRQAIAHAIDRDTLFDRVLLGLGEKGTVLVPSVDPFWKPALPADLEFAFDPALANSMLEDAGYVDTDGDGVREMPGGGQPLNLRYVQRSESTSEPQLTEFITGWLEDIGIATTVEVFDDSQLTDVVSAGEFDLFSWGWTPYVDPDPMLSYFTCAQVSYAADDYGYNDANWCTPEYDALYDQQHVELRSGQAPRHRPPDGPRLLRGSCLCRAVRGRRPPGLPDRSVRGLGAPARRDRCGVLLQFVAQLHPSDPSWRRERRRVEHRPADRWRRRRHRGPGWRRLCAQPSRLGRRAHLSRQRQHPDIGPRPRSATAGRDSGALASGRGSRETTTRTGRTPRSGARRRAMVEARRSCRERTASSDGPDPRCG
ncbi:MAG: ABC transporter substrate-binding protein [Acidimicrobiales bacterium]